MDEENNHSVDEIEPENVCVVCDTPGCDDLDEYDVCLKCHARIARDAEEAEAEAEYERRQEEAAIEGPSVDEWFARGQ